MDASSFLHGCEPPWLVFPSIDPAELSQHLKQGVAEPWFDQRWRPFWASLDAEQRQQYLDFWMARPAWRDAIAFHFCEEGDSNLA
jgi:hypothetical protein